MGRCILSRQLALTKLQPQIVSGEKRFVARVWPLAKTWSRIYSDSIPLLFLRYFARTATSFAKKPFLVFVALSSVIHERLAVAHLVALDFSCCFPVLPIHLA
jgi:hypothetical protein